MMRRIAAVACATAVLTVAAPGHANPSPGCSLETVRTRITTRVADERTRDCLEHLIAAHKDDSSWVDSILCPIFASWSPGAWPVILIFPEGDVFLLRDVFVDDEGRVYYVYERFWDCPPYNW